MGFFSSLFGLGSSSSSATSTTYSPSVNKENDGTVNLDSVRPLLNSKIAILKSGSVTKNDFYAGFGDPPEIRDLVKAAIDVKRRGDLVSANQYYCECLRRSKTFHSPLAWSWCKIMILAKNWECLRDLLEFHFVMMVAWNRIMKKDGNQEYFDNYARCNMVPHLEFDEFHAGEELRDLVQSPLMEREETISRLSDYGGSPYWSTNYNINEAEWREFQRIFPLPEL